MSRKRTPLSDLEPMPDFPVNIMLDSGAFGAWTRDQVIDVEDYIAFIRVYGHLFDSIVNLDAIPGDFGRKKTPEDVERSALISYEHLQMMKDAGIPAIPVFHQGERFEHLERLVDDGEPYIGISPSGDNISMNTDWFDAVFRLLTDKEGWPVVKTHGFGVTSIPILRRYPWYSADSMTWVIKSGYGCVFAPKQDPHTGQPDYGENPISIWVTGAARKNERFEFELSEMWRGDDAAKLTAEYLTRFMYEDLGVNWFEMRYEPYARMHAMARYFQLGARYSDYAPYVRTSSSFLQPPSTRPRVTWETKKLIFAIGPPTNVRRSHVLNDLGIRERLLSYFDLRECPPEEIENYARAGATRPLPKPKVRRSHIKNYSNVEYWNKRKLALAKELHPELFGKREALKNGTK